MLYEEIVGYNVDPFLVWYVCKNIFQTSRTSTPEIYATKFKIAASKRNPPLNIEIIHGILKIILCILIVIYM